MLWEKNLKKKKVKENHQQTGRPLASCFMSLDLTVYRTALAVGHRAASRP